MNESEKGTNPKMRVEFESLCRGTVPDGLLPRMEISSECQGTVVLTIFNKDRTASELVEIGTGVLIQALLAIGAYDQQSSAKYDEAYRFLQSEAVREFFRNHPQEKAKKKRATDE